MPSPCNRLISLTALLLLPLTAFAQASCTRTVKYDSLPTGVSPPNPYGGVSYNGFVVSAEQGSLAPASGSKYITATNSFVASIHFESGPAGSQAQGIYLRSVQFGCITGSAAGITFPTGCDLSIIAESPFFRSSIQSTTLSYTQYNHSIGPSKMQHFALVDDKTNPGSLGPGGQTIHLSLSAGGGLTQYFLDNLVYEFFPCSSPS